MERNEDKRALANKLRGRDFDGQRGKKKAVTAGTGGAGMEAGECESEVSAMLEIVIVIVIMIMITIVEPERPQGFRPVRWGGPAEGIRRTDRKRKHGEQQRCQRQVPLLSGSGHEYGQRSHY